MNVTNTKPGGNTHSRRGTAETDRGSTGAGEATGHEVGCGNVRWRGRREYMGVEGTHTELAVDGVAGVGAAQGGGRDAARERSGLGPGRGAGDGGEGERQGDERLHLCWWAEIR